MTNSQADFRKWFVDSLSPLRPSGDTGFIFLLVAIPILERYLRRKSRCPDGQELNEAFFNELSKFLGEISGRERDFWSCYRNGLLHHVTFAQAKWMKKEKEWRELPKAAISGHDPRPVYFDQAKNEFYVNPIAFFDLLTIAVLADFATYESDGDIRYSLLSTRDPLGAMPNVVPTINLNLPKPSSTEGNA
jgi:hypothetical protein